jgi:hypothetical protein
VRGATCASLPMTLRLTASTASRATSSDAMLAVLVSAISPATTSATFLEMNRLINILNNLAHRSSLGSRLVPHTLQPRHHLHEVGLNAACGLPVDCASADQLRSDHAVGLLFSPAQPARGASMDCVCRQI